MRWAALARFAARDLRGGFSGLRVFLACLAIGVAAIVGVESTARSLQDGLAREGRRLAGGDVSFSLMHRQLSAEERAFLAARGALDDVATMRAMARNAAGDATLADVKAVGPDWPPIGEASFAPAARPSEALASEGGAFGAEVDDVLLDRLGLKPGDGFDLGAAHFVIHGRVVSEPDSLASGIGFGAHVLISRAALAATGLVQPGSLVRNATRVKMGDAPPSEAAVKAFVAEAKSAFPQAGWEVRDRSKVSPEFSRNIDRFGEFLALVGLTSLVVGGVGVANAAQGFLERKRATLAILKALGLTGPEAVAAAAMQFLAVGALGIALGVVAGALMPYLVAGVAGAALPYPFEPGLYPNEWALGALYGALAALAFSLTPLGRAHDLPATALFRDQVAGEALKTRWRYRGAAAGAAVLLAGTAVFFSPTRNVALTVVVAVALSLVALRGVAAAAMALARRAPRRGPFEWRLALSNLHRPGAPTPAAVLSLGLGLGLLVALALVDVNLRQELRPGVTGAPDFYFLDVRGDQEPAFREFLSAQAPGAKIGEAPMMRGRIAKVAGVEADKARVTENAQWALEGDRGLSYADAVPAGSELVAGAWWAKDYEGPPLVSVEEEIAKGLGLKLGDAITVNVLGRDVTATVANLRRVNWRSFAINFVLVFSSNTFRGAPHTALMTAQLPKGGGAGADGALVRATAKAFPDVVSLKVRDALQTVETLVAKLDTAIRWAALIALASAVLTLAGALSANARARAYDAVTLKILGATRTRLIVAALYEFAALGAATSLFGVGAGALAAFVIVSRVMGLDFAFAWAPALAAALGGLALTVVLGLVGVWRTLGLKPARALRSL